MDRSGHWGDWSDSILIPIPPRLSSTSPYATAFNQGRHLVKYKDDLNMVYETDGKIIYCFSQDNGEHWFSEDLGQGLFPNIGVNQIGLPWVAFWRENCVIAKMKDVEDSWSEVVVFQADNHTWAGAPAIALGTVPGPELPAFAYITYPVY